MSTSGPGIDPRLDPSRILPCKCLRAKEMFYENSLEGEDKFKNSVFWCVKTQEAFGPDGLLAGRTECSSDRSCFLE